MKPKKGKSRNGIGVKSDSLLKIGLVLTIIIFVFIIYKIFDTQILSSERINLSGEKYYQYFSGILKEYSGKMNILEKEGETQLVLENGEVIYLDSTPMYYKEVLGKVLFAKEMQLVVPDERNYKFKKFTNIIEENNMMFVKRVNKEKRSTLPEGAFLYDGDDLYFFLSEMNIRVGKDEYTVSPFSYAIVNYRNSVEIYDYAKEQYIIIDDKESLEPDVIASNLQKNYDINMSVDSLSTEKAQQLLINNFNNLTEYVY